MAEELRIGITASALCDTAREAPQMARLSGFSGLLFDAYGSDMPVPDLSATGRREFLHLLSSQNQQLVGLRYGLGPKGLGPGADVDWTIGRLDRVMEAAAGLQAPLVCVDLGALPEPAQHASKPPAAITPQQAGLIIIPTLAAAPAPETTRQPLPAKVDPLFVSQVAGVMAELGERADRYSVMVAFRSELASFAALEETISHAACPWFGLDLDPVAVLHDPWEMDEVFSRMGALVRHVRARDAVRGADRRTQATAIGQGNVNWEEFLGDLDDAGYHGWITVDPVDLTDRSGSAAAAVKHLRRLRERRLGAQ